MNRNLSAMEFSQLTIPGTEVPRVEKPAPEEKPPSTDPLDNPRYFDDEAHNERRWRWNEPVSAKNPLYTPDAEYDFVRSSYMMQDDPRVEHDYVPTWRLSSIQDVYNPQAVEHQVRHADPMALREDPLLATLHKDGEEHYSVLDGNHRTLAAQRRGQLLMPARVLR